MPIIPVKGSIAVLTWMRYSAIGFKAEGAGAGTQVPGKEAPRRGFYAEGKSGVYSTQLQTATVIFIYCGFVNSICQFI